MTVYQIHVHGECDCVSDQFKCGSKTVYRQRPTQEQINEFIEKCTTGGFWNLDTRKPYEVHIVELELV